MDGFWCGREAAIGSSPSDKSRYRERGEESFGAYVPDLPGCVAAGETREEVMRLIREAIEFHLEGLREGGLPVPPPSSIELVHVDA
jgi:predicted RNase H-like HicB family nuclease